MSFLGGLIAFVAGVVVGVALVGSAVLSAPGHMQPMGAGKRILSGSQVVLRS